MMLTKLVQDQLSFSHSLYILCEEATYESCDKLSVYLIRQCGIVDFE